MAMKLLSCQLWSGEIGGVKLIERVDGGVIEGQQQRETVTFRG